MTIQEVQRQLRKEPFEPFRILTADGQTYDVRHPENLAFAGKGRLVSVGLDDGTFMILDLLLVTGIQYPIPHTPQKSEAA